MTDPFTRRDLLRNTGAGLLASGAVVAGMPAPAGAQGAQGAGAESTGRRLVNVVQLGADRTGRTDASAQFQQAIDMLAPTGGTLYIPAGSYKIGQTLVWKNDENRRAPGILFLGDGVHSTVLLSEISSGPLLRVRGVKSSGHVDTSLFWGGGLRDLSLRGNDAGPGQHGLEVLGWCYGEIHNCHFVGFGGDGIRALTDLALSPNPDFTSSTLFVRGTWFERLGGWGFIDTSVAQGAPGWSWDRVVFIMCRRGGAHVRSGAHSFTSCSFGLNGWQSERGPVADTAYGLYFDGGATACSQQIVQGCEFDNNLTAHIGARFLAASSFFSNRFNFNDYLHLGRLCPAKGIEIGIGDYNACVLGVLFRQSFFRIDMAGEMIAYDFVNSANVRDVEIGGSVFTIPAGAHVTRYRGHDPQGHGAAYGYIIHDRPPEDS
jgi:hypothetical protein